MTDEATRRVLLIVNPRRAEARDVIAVVVPALESAGVEVAITDEDRAAWFPDHRGIGRACR
jgi:hypothetical protein